MITNLYLIDKNINAEIPQWRYIEKSLARHKKKNGSKITKKQAEIFHFGDGPSDFEDVLYSESDKYKKQSFFWGACSEMPEGESDGGSGCEDDFIDSKLQRLRFLYLSLMLYQKHKVRQHI